MKKWLTEFFDDMRYIWGEFVREVNSATTDDDTDALYTHDTLHAHIYGHDYDH